MNKIYEKGVTRNQQAYSHTIAILMSKLRVSLDAAWKQLRSSLEAVWSILRVFLEYVSPTTRLRLVGHEITAHSRRDYGSLTARFLRPFSSKRAELERRLTISMLLMLTLGSSSVWGATINFNLPNGYYYLGNDAGDNGVPAYDGSNFETNFYMCPAYSAIVNEQNYLGGDSEKPLITTFKSFFDADKNQGKTYSWAVWFIEAATGDNAGYFYIKHRDSGQYLIANDNTSPKANRRRVNLGPTSEPGNDCLFRIQSDDEGVTYYISSKTKNNGNNKYLNPSSANLDNIAATIANDNTGGIIGFWSAKNKNSAWHFVLVPTEKSTITYDNTTNEVTMVSATTGATIYYTADGSEPDKDHVGGSNPTKQYDPNSKPTISTPTIIKAIAVADSYDVSEVRSLSIQKVETPIKSISSTGMIELSSATPFSSIYYTIGNTEPEDPTTSSKLYTVPLDNAVGKYIKAIGVKEGWINSDILSTGQIQLQCATPIITRVGKTFTISCSLPADAIIYYSINGGSETLYSGPVAFTNDQLPLTVTAVAKHSSFTDSEEASVVLHNGSGTPEDPYLISGDTDFTDFVTNVNNGTAADKCFKLIFDVSASGTDAITTEFTGAFDGSGYTISGLGHALFNIVNGGVVKNVILDDVNISSGTNVGAIANKVTGTSSKVASVYNCGILSGSISGSGYVGSIVGQLGDDSNNDNCYARVINCYSYATISGGSSVGGIVGYNSFASAANNLRTMVMNCMYYGKITGGSNKAPIYNGQNITNVGANGLANYNYYFSGCTFTGGIDTYNCALAADERYLTRFEFYRRMLNSNGELAAWYATGSTENRSEMYKWILLPSSYGTEHPFPVLAPQDIYPSVINLDTDNAPTTDEPNKGRNMGTLSVTIQSGNGAQFNAPTGASIVKNHMDLTITDKDYDHFNYNYRKVQLPYYNEVGTGNYTGNRVVTGWKIVSVSGGTTHYSTGDDVVFNDDGSIKSTPYNFADRKCTDKDLYGTGGSNRIFSQGAYWDVPDGVTSITIEPYWGKAAYLCDQYWNVVYSKDHTTSYNVTIMGEHYQNGTSYDIAGSSQEVYNTLSNAVDALSSDASHSVYDYAVVLVGNYHLVKQAASINDGTNPFTVMSADFDKDNEPDYSFILQFSSRQNTAPIRFDFINIPGLGMAQKSYEATSMPNVGIFKPSGWFEITNTTTILLGQFEYDRGAKVLAPLILHGGIIEQIVSNNDGNTALTKTQYIHMGSNVWLASFTPGIHQDRTAATKHVPVSVTGGEYQEFHLTGMYRADASIYNDDAECYIHGGKFGEITGTGLEGIGHPTNHTKGNITWVIDQADITNFFGGGINAAKPSQGNIYTEITNSNVTLFCGGPKFGDMQTGRTVTTKATDCTFGTFFGAGYGGNSYNRFSPKNKTDAINYEWNTWINANYTCAYSSDADKNGISTNFAYEFIPMSGGMTTNVARLFVNYISFSLATTGDVTSTLTGCKVTGNFYGGGNLGKVNGDATSVLTNCTLEKSAFGAGFSATLPTVEVMATGGFTTEPEYDPDGGVYSQGVFPSTTTYTWQHAASPSIDKDKHILYTTEDLTSLGIVTKTATLTINGTTTVAESVYGGGCEADVLGNTNVSMTDGYIFNGIFGGGYAGSVGTFTRSWEEEDVNIYGHTTHDGCIGKPVSCAEGTGKCTVVVSGGQIGPISVATQGMNRPKAEGGPVPEGWVWGAGQGLVEDPTTHPDTHFTSYVGETDVTIKGNALVMESIIGGGEFGRVLGNTLVKIEGGQIGIGEGMIDEDNKPIRYTDDQFVNPLTTPITSSNALAECSHYPYGRNIGTTENPNWVYLPYDPYCEKYPDYFAAHPEFAPASTSNPSDGKTWIGCVFAGGSGYMPYEKKDGTGYDWCPSAGLVEGDTEVRISGGHILTNVYGGNEITDVKGTSKVKMTGGTIGVPRTLEQIVEHPLTCYLFGAGKGDERSRFYDYTNTGSVEVEISGGIIYGSVFGGSEDGHVTGDIKMDIKPGAIIGTWGTSYVDGNVFGGGRGFSGNTLTAGNVGGNVTMNISGGNILGSVYGGGRLASVGTYLVETTDVNYYGKQIPDVGDDKHGHITINISGGTIGNDKEYIYNPTAEQKAAIPNTTFDYQNHLQYAKGGNVFTGGMGRLYALDGKTVLTSWQKLGQCKQTVLNMTGGTVKSSVYGGGEIGIVAQNATLNINGGTVGTKVVDSEDETKYYYFGSVFGGGKGSTENIEGISAAGTTQGNVEVHLNKDVASDDEAKGAIVNQVFGCNDMNGSPKGDVTVHVYATQNADKDNISTKYDKGTETFDVEAVYGGGNLAAYEPTNLETGKAKVIIDGCGLTSIRQVYGGGNAASTPATNVVINGTYEIEELFGGGNGFDNLPDGKPNPGANVGYKNYTVYEQVGEEWIAKDDPDYDTKEERIAEGSAITYGTGQASINVFGGTVHRVFGGSNTKGNVRQTAVTLLDENSGCEFCVDEAYGGGKSAPMDAEAKLLMACIPGLQAAYGGAEAAAIKGNVTLNITNGTFDRVFGGNNLSGTIDGSITVNIEEVGCRPIKIGELYGGGNQAGYSVYGYNDDGTPKETGTKLYEDPQVNVMSFTSIGKVFGGGYGSGATMVGNPTVSVNEVYGKYYNDDSSVVNEGAETPNHYPIPSHAKGKMGAIHTVFGGGNAAKVMGNTTVNIATQAEVYVVKEVTAGAALPEGCYTRSGAGTTDDPFVYTTATGTASADVTYYEKKEVLGVDIRDNVYGGGNNAQVTGNAVVNVGKKVEE